MEQVFIEHLDRLFWAGYGIEFKEENPDAFYRQLVEFIELYNPSKKIS